MRTVVVLAAPILVSRLLTDYGDRFSAYSYGSVGERVASIVNRFGLLGLVVVVVCARRPLFDAEDAPNGGLAGGPHGLHICNHGQHSGSLASALVPVLAANSPDHRPRRRSIDMEASGGGRRRVAHVRPRRCGPGHVSRGIHADSVGLWDRLGPVVPADVIRPRVRHDLPEVKRLLAYLDHLREGAGGLDLHSLELRPTLRSCARLRQSLDGHCISGRRRRFSVGRTWTGGTDFRGAC